ncbi:MAG: DUF1674 domain-containing protein [Geminicoccaceae bacterium]
MTDRKSQSPLPARTDQRSDAEVPAPDSKAAPRPARHAQIREKETGGPKGPEPTRYGDWEKGGRCFDF